MSTHFHGTLMVTKGTAGQNSETLGRLGDHIMINDPLPSRDVDR